MRYHGILRDGISRDEKNHGTPRDGIEISRDLTGRGFTGRKKHGTPRDGIEISRDCTGRDVKTILHGTCTVHSKHSSVSYDIIRLHFQYCIIREHDITLIVVFSMT